MNQMYQKKWRSRKIKEREGARRVRNSVNNRKSQRYGSYVEELQEPINEKNWQEFLKRVAIMKKILSKRLRTDLMLQEIKSWILLLSL